MNDKKLVFLVLLLPLIACQDERKETVIVSANDAVAGKPAPAIQAASQDPIGKPSAPISMRYEVLGKPVVGSPVAINIEFNTSGDQGPVAVHYSIVDRSALRFQQGQVESLEVDVRRGDRTRQLAIIPQREGRLYVNVSVEIQTPDGSMIKSMAIPIQVGSAPQKPEINGELVEGPDGETVISMPAQEN